MAWCETQSPPSGVWHEAPVSDCYKCNPVEVNAGGWITGYYCIGCVYSGTSNPCSCAEGGCNIGSFSDRYDYMYNDCESKTPANAYIVSINYDVIGEGFGGVCGGDCQVRRLRCNSWVYAYTW